MLSFKAKFLRKPKKKRIDITDLMMEAGDIIAQEIRGNIKRGTDITEGVSHSLNKPGYAKNKLRRLGHQKPLQAFGKTLVSKSSYIVKRMGINSVRVMLTSKGHPKSKTPISEIGAYNDQGTSKIKARHFFDISKIARKRIIGKVADAVARAVHAL